MEPDWDLHAVVKGFADMNKSTHVIADLDHSGSSSVVESSNMARKQGVDQWHHGFCSTNLAGAEVLQELGTQSYLLDPRQAQSVQPTISSYWAALQAYKKRTQHKGGDSIGTNSTNKHFQTNSCSSAAAPTQTTQKPKKRKKHQKNICHVPAEALSSDVWSWRKYGQKPIKGSPYPRSYYKCSSSKACLARKQVERNRSGSNMFIVTYTAEHNHPAPTHKNCLAGTTRKPNSLAWASDAVHDESNLTNSKPCSSNSMATMSPGGSLDDEVLQQSREMEYMSIDGGDLNMTNMVGDVMEFLNMDSTDDFYGDLEDISSSPMGWFSPDQFLPSFPWIANNGSASDM